MMSFNLGLGEFVGESSRTLSLDPFAPRFSFSKISTELSSSHYTKYLCFVPPLHIYGHHQGAIASQETTHHEYLHMKKFIHMWHGPEMV
jgi:hypothetical protein